MNSLVNRFLLSRRATLPRTHVIRALAAFSLLMAALARPAAAQLARQTFEVNLGSGVIPGPLPFDEPFFLSATAPENLLEVRLWVDRELRRNQCSRVVPAESTDRAAARAAAHKQDAPIPLQLSSRWARAGLDSVTRFELEAGPLSPNRDYTFCFHLLRKPTAADSAAFSARATRNLAAALAKFAGKVITDPGEPLDSLQQALIDALPTADTVVFLESSSIFVKPTNEPDPARLKRLNRLIVLATDYLQTATNLATDVGSDATKATATGKALTSILTDPTLLKLSAISNASIPAGLDSTHLLATAMLAGRISRFTPGDIVLIARGFHSLNGSPRLGATRDLTDLTASASRAQYADTLARTLSALRDIASLAALATERPGADAESPTSAELNQLLNHITTAMVSIDDQMQNLLNISQAVDDRSALIQKLVNSVRSLDFARIALRSTTSDTYKARANSYLSLDAGLLTARDLNQVAPYLGVNFYFRPVNKNAPLGWCPCWGRRLSLSLGITTGSVAEKDRIADTFNGHSIFTGVGGRVTDYWRISLGLLLVRTYRDEPPAKLQFGAVPGISTSLDIDVIGLLGKAGTLLF